MALSYLVSSVSSGLRWVLSLYIFCFVLFDCFCCFFFNDLDNHEESGVLQNVPQFGSYHFYQL